MNPLQTSEPANARIFLTRRSLSINCGSVVVAIGILVILGWYLHWNFFARAFPDVLAMKYNTALAFILCGASVTQLWQGSKKISVALAALVFVFMSLSFIENLSGLDFKFDALFFDSYQHSDVFPNRVSPLTAASFILTASALMLSGGPLSTKFRLAVIGMVACGVAMISLVAMFGYTFGIESASGWGSYTRMSLYTAMTFILLSAGLFVWALTMAEQSNFNFIRWLPVSGSVTLMAMIALVSTVSFIQLQSSSAWRLHTYKVLDSAQALLSDIFDTQRGMRAYVLTGDPSTLTLFKKGSTGIPGDLSDLISLARDNSRQQENLKVFSGDINELMSYSHRLLLARQHDLHEAIILESGGEGFAVLNRTLADLQNVNDEEHRLLIVRTAKADADFHNTSRLLTYGSILAAALLVLANILATHEVQRRERIEDQLRIAMAQQTELTLKAQIAEKAKGEFLSSMSHELRTPLNAILGFAQLMEVEVPAPNPYQTKCIRQILQGGWYLLELINEVLDLAAIESGKISMSDEAVSLSAVLSTCRNMMEPQAKQREIRMIFPSFEEMVYVRADHTRLKQVLINLLSNAIKYNKERGTVRVDCIAVQPGRIRIRVTDTGAGLSPEKMAQLFIPFNRLGQESGNVEGTGIGLVTSKRLAELMGGRLGVESTEGEGCTFWCELTAAVAPSSSPAGVSFPALFPANLGGATRQHTLLYVEDNPANMLLVQELIARFSELNLMTATNATKGIELAREVHPDVIFMDINLPGISGFKALELLQKDPLTSAIPVVALSANAMPREIEKGLKMGFFSYLTKPIKINEFSDALRAALKANDKQTAHATAKSHVQLV